MGIQFVSRKGLKRISILLALLIAVFIGLAFYMVRMPGQSYSGPLPSLAETDLARLVRLRQDLLFLAGTIGERNVFVPRNLNSAIEFLNRSYTNAGYEVRQQEFQALGENVSNIEVELTGREKADEIVIIGAHYDSVPGSPGANDNGTGVVAVLELARAFASKQPSRTIRFVAFVNEEAPFFQEYQHPGMGSWEYARRCRARNENIYAMISLETIGFYADVRGSQRYPKPLNLFYPEAGNFIAFVGNISSRKLVHRSISRFRANTRFPSEGVATFSFIPGIGWSDHWAFWEEGYPAIMVTDTAPFRYPYYHSSEDTVDKIDSDRLTRVVTGMEKVIDELAGTP